MNLEAPANDMLTSKGDRPTPAWLQWLTRIGRVVGAGTQSGTTANRPTKDLWVGRFYFDTDLGHPIWYDGTDWVDATGTPV